MTDTIIEKMCNLVQFLMNVGNKSNGLVLKLLINASLSSILGGFNIAGALPKMQYVPSFVVGSFGIVSI